MSEEPETKTAHTWWYCVVHDWYESGVVLDMAPHGIHFRECRACHRVETWGPDEEPWHVRQRP